MTTETIPVTQTTSPRRPSGDRRAYSGPGMIATGEATAILPTTSTAPIKVFGTESIRETFDDLCLQQAVNSRMAPGVTDLILNPDAHCGYGAPVGSVMVSPTHIYPGPVGVDIKCSMSLLQLDLPAEAIVDRKVRRALISAICQRTPTGAGKGQRSVKQARHVNRTLGKQLVVEGASKDVCMALGIPTDWIYRCEDSFHVGHDDTQAALETRLETLLERRDMTNFSDKMQQLGSYGGGNHFGECEVVEVADNDRARSVAETFGLSDGKVAFLSHCGSRGFGHVLASGQFKHLQIKFDRWGIPLPGGDRELVYAPLGSEEANDYIDDMSLGANFATVNHLLINALVLEAFQEVIPGTQGKLVYFISHNIARKEVVDNRIAWVHRKGATRAMPAGHHALRETPFANSGHPILLPGNPRDGSAVMVADAGAEASRFSVNHGAGRILGRRHAARTLDQSAVDSEMDSHDILSNCRKYPIDEAPAAYKDFNEVLRSVKTAGLASEVARLKARFVIKDASKADD